MVEPVNNQVPANPPALIPIDGRVRQIGNVVVRMLPARHVNNRPIYSGQNRDAPSTMRSAAEIQPNDAVENVGLFPQIVDLQFREEARDLASGPMWP